jgi:hypothetical protein
VGGTVLGPRVPALLVSPYSARGSVNHSQLDYTSALSFIEYNWGVDPLTGRDAGARSIATALDFVTPPRPAQIVQAGAPVRGPRVAVATAYLGYLGAAGLAAALLLAAVGGPSVVTAVRRRRVAAAAKDPDRVLAGVVIHRRAGGTGEEE